MGIPTKDRVSFISQIAEDVLKIQQIKSLPKGKLLRWTLFFMGSSFGLWYFVGPLGTLRKTDRHLREARELYEKGGKKSTESGPGTEVIFKSYGLDYKQKLSDSKSEDSSS